MHVLIFNNWFLKTEFLFSFKALLCTGSSCCALTSWVRSLSGFCVALVLHALLWYLGGGPYLGVVWPWFFRLLSIQKLILWHIIISQFWHKAAIFIHCSAQLMWSRGGDLWSLHILSPSKCSHMQMLVSLQVFWHLVRQKDTKRGKHSKERKSQNTLGLAGVSETCFLQIHSELCLRSQLKDTMPFPVHSVPCAASLLACPLFLQGLHPSMVLSLV